MSNNNSDHVSKDWTVEITIDEHEGRTRAKARLRWRDQESSRCRPVAARSNGPRCR